MNTSVVVDASIWVSWLWSFDTNHHVTNTWMEQYIANDDLFVVPSLLLIEVAASISRQTGQTIRAKEAINRLSSISKLQIVPLDSSSVQAAVDVATDLQLRAGDAIYVALAHQMNIPLVSWDKEQLQRASRLIATYTPENYVFPDDSEKSNNEHGEDVAP